MWTFVRGHKSPFQCWLTRAEQELLRALDALSKLHAMNGMDHTPDLYRKAAKENARAHKFMDDVSYHQARRAANLSTLYSEAALEKVRAMQPPDVSAEVVWSNGKVEWLAKGMKDIGSNWKVLLPARRLMAGDRVRTGNGIRAVLVFHDKTRLELKSKTELELIQVSFNEQDNQADSEISIIQGEIYSEVTPANNKDIPNYRVRYGNYSIAFRGTTTRLYSDAMSVTEGEVKFRSGFFEDAFPQGKAALISKNGIEKVDLIPAPQMHLVPRKFAPRVIPLSWGGINGAVKYEIEVAKANKDNSFIDLADSGSVAGNLLNWDTKELKTGKYIWRVTGIDHQDLLGMPSMNGEFEVINNLAFNIQALNPLKGQFTTRNNRIFVRPSDIEHSIKHFELSVNGGEFEPITEDGISVGEAGKHLLVFRSHAFSGETLTKKQTIVVDDTHPETQIRQTRIQGTDEVELSLTASDDMTLDSVSLTVDGIVHTDPAKLVVRVPLGSEIVYQAIDKAGNETPAHRRTVGVDGLE